jgi:hypothetical protein
MVKGLDLFKRHFADHTDAFVLIGGTAISVSMDNLGVPFRATQDLDIVLIVEMLRPEFGRAFWDFIDQGAYRIQQSSEGERRFYRFDKPESPGFPKMLELFSRVPDAIIYGGERHLTPIPLGEEVSSLSALLLNEEYYNLIHSGQIMVNDLPVVRAEHLIPLKARAYADLKERRSKGASVDSKSVSKHKNDIFRLSQIMVPTALIGLPASIAEDLRECLSALRGEAIDLKALGIRGQTVNGIIDALETCYGLNR